MKINLVGRASVPANRWRPETAAPPILLFFFFMVTLWVMDRLLNMTKASFAGFS
jgi:hypothetical protein